MAREGSPVIAAAICTYDYPDTFTGALESLLKQTLPRERCEIVVVDGVDPPPGPLRLMESAGVVRLRDAKGSLSAARNAAIARTTAPVVAFLDDDAVASPGWLDALARAFDETPECWIAGGKVLPLWAAPPPAWLQEDLHRSLSLLDWGDERRPLAWPERVIGTNLALRREAVAEVGAFAENLGRQRGSMLGSEDTEIQQRVHARGKLVLHEPLAVVHHHVPSSRMTKRYFYRRAFGGGQSDAVGDWMARGRRAALVRASRCVAQLALGAALSLPSLPREIPRFKAASAHAYRLGYLRQAGALLWRSRS